MSYHDSHAAAEVLGREITLTRNFVERIEAALARLTSNIRFGGAMDASKRDVMADLDYPDERTLRS